MNQKGTKQIPLLIIIAVVLIGAIVYGYFFYNKDEEASKNTNTGEKNANIAVTNTNKNANLNTNVSVNENVNVSSNTNATINTNTNTPIPVPEVEEIVVDNTYTNSECGYSLTLPDGWYAYDQTNGVLFLMSATLPSVGATEGYAYGTQFSIACGDISEAGAITSTEYLDAMIGNLDAYDNPIVRQNVVRNGLNMVRFTMSAAGADGTILNYYYFNGTTYYDLSHFSYDQATTASQDFEAVLNTFSITP